MQVDLAIQTKFASWSIIDVEEITTCILTLGKNPPGVNALPVP